MSCELCVKVNDRMFYTAIQTDENGYTNRITHGVAKSLVAQRDVLVYAFTMWVSSGHVTL